MPDYPIMTHFYRFVATVWTSDYLKRHGDDPRPLIEQADLASAEATRFLGREAHDVSSTNESVEASRLRAGKIDESTKGAAKAISKAQSEVLMATQTPPGDQVTEVTKAISQVLGEQATSTEDTPGRSTTTNDAAATGLAAAVAAAAARALCCCPPTDPPEDPVWAAAVRPAGRPTNGLTALVNASNAWTIALKESGVDVKPHRIIHVHRNTATEYHYVIPEPPATDPYLLESSAENAIPYMMTCD